MGKRTPPDWSTGDPPQKGVYVGFSDHEQRRDWPDIYSWDGRVWQHHSGWFDNKVSHWIFLRELG